MEIKESIAYLRPIADSSHLKQYSAALDTAIRCMEEVEELKEERDAWEKVWCKEHNRAVKAEAELIDERDRFDRLTDFELAEAKELELYRELGAIDNLCDLLQAEKDGRLVVLPCRDDVELERNGQTFRADHWNHSLTAFRDAPETKSGKQVALFSIQEAEAALKGGEG